MSAEEERAREVAGRLTKAQRDLLLSRKVPNDYRARDAFLFERIGVLCFTPMGDVISTPLGLSVRRILMEERS